MEKELENRLIVICLSFTTIICLLMLFLDEHIEWFWRVLLIFTFLQWVSFLSKKKKKQ